MCGITGAVWNDPAKAIAPDVLRRMTDALEHRGPDDQGQYFGEPAGLHQPGVALGHRRLSIIDLAGGHQPLANEDQTVWVVLNGEIYNYRQLRRRLEGNGHHFRTASDTEVLVHLYEDVGPALPEHLNGMFALAVWDANRRQLLLARDRLGEKPLVYREEPGRLAFASQIKSLLEIPGVPRQVDPQAVDEYLTYQYVPHSRCIFRGMNKLPPGHRAVYRDGRLDVQPYWQLPADVEEPRSEEDYAERLDELLTSAVELRMQSDVPLGAFLSGGVDSTIIVGLMRRLTTATLRTFSIGFDVPEYDETGYARLVAQRFETQHEEFRVEPQTVDVLPRLAWHFDEPMADSSALPTWYLSKLTRRHVTVALTGDGGDELLAGYPRYRAVRLAGALDRLPALVRRFLGAGWWQKLPSSGRQKSVVRRWKRFAEALGMSPARRYVDWISIFNETRRGELYADDFVHALPDVDPTGFVTSAWRQAGGRDPVTAASLADLVTYLPCDLMTKVDVASMAHALECRAPFLDHRVVELAARMPVGMKFRSGRGKYLLRQRFADLLPRAVARRAKMGFGVPLDHWFRGQWNDYVAQVLLDPQTLGRGYFRPEAVRRLLDEHSAGRFDHSHRLWALLILELWHRQWT